ncbi:MAG: hypothetical protein OMM_02505 [Candidatus Magnetoglobus multicellularis str. Araruama]|uniref:Uncharacterized protein n=1 Tax=Candidatus Magnetoglobus multicellularis str. Araruama TaxID=890399 RepID=A0A1V1P989_9BACT|nr:MAG: hypothetical protein OMM_02505 [Candidatus Magnetoglobus multicellularis str. Araruama]
MVKDLSISCRTDSTIEKIDVAIGADTTYLAMDHYECSLIVTSDDILTPTITIPVSLDVVESTPVIDVYPDQLTFELMENEQDLKKLSIINQGSNPLVWNMTTSCQPDEKNTYSWIDSDMPGGPIFDWIDITKNGKPINNLKDDSFAGPFPIGFSFSFYGETYEKFYAASNGLIAFGASTGLSERSNDAIPEKRAPNNFLAWFWDDLIPRNARVFYKTLDEKLIVSFIDYGQFGNTGTVTAQVILYVDGSIVYQYQHFRDGFKSSTATIGIENKQGTEGVQVAKNVPYLHDLHAIRFQSDPCQWLNIAPVSGTISSMSTESVAVKASAKDMPQGKYNAILQINSNDKAHNPIDIPVHLIVKGQSHPPVIKSEILSPKSKDMIYATTFPIKGTATATEQETIERVEISFDSGTTWKVASGKNQWRYEWTVPSESGKYSICVRAVGHSGDYQTALTQVQVNVIQRSNSRVLIDGRTMSVNDNIFQIKGVGYAPTPIGHDPETQTPYGDYFTKNYNKIHTRDFPLLRVMGANTLRLLHWDPTADHTHFLDNAFNNGIDSIFVIPGFWINSGYNIDPNSPSNHRNQIKQDFLDMVRIHMNHPAILMWCIGNELNADWMYGKEMDYLFSLINEMALAAKNLEGRTYHPTTTALIDINLSNTIKGFNSKVPDIAAWGATVYRGDSFGELFTDFSKISDKPLIILGFGIDALNNKTLKEYETDGLSKQSEYARALWREINQNKHICLGASITAYADEWWKGKNASDPLCKDDDPSLHGFCGYASDAHPDGYANEEWWGIVRVIKNGQDSDIVQPRSVYYELQTAWNFNPIPPKEYKIVPKDCNRSDNFGRSVSIYGKYAVGGAKGDDTNGGNSGAVYMMHFNGDNWVKNSKLLPDDGQVNDYFGCSVGLFDDFALFGAYGKDGPGSKSGAAYIFALKSSGWEQYQKLVADDADANDYFGYAVDIHENYAIIGAYGDDDKGNMSGAAYIFKRQADNTWVQQQKLLDDRGDRNDQFGYAVDICDTHAIVGAYRDDDKGDSSGSAIIFKREQNMWIQQARLNARDGQSNDYFGFDVAISKDYAAVGAYRSDDEPRYNIGSVYIFKHDKGIWNHQAKIVPNDGSSNDYFGSSVDMIGSRLLIGAYGDGDKGPSSGAAYLYCLDQDEWKFQKSTLPARENHTIILVTMSLLASRA